MAANRIGKLYQYTGRSSIPIWKEPSSFTYTYDSIGVITPNIPFLIIDKHDEPALHEHWIKILYKEQVGWVNSTYVNIDWVDPEEYV